MKRKDATSQQIWRLYSESLNSPKEQVEDEEGQKVLQLAKSDFGPYNTEFIGQAPTRDDGYQISISDMAVEFLNEPSVIDPDVAKRMQDASQRIKDEGFEERWSIDRWDSDAVEEYGVDIPTLVQAWGQKHGWEVQRMKRSEDEEIHSAGDAVAHHWAETIAHPSLGAPMGENEEFEVYDHSLTEDGVVEEYYVHFQGNLYALPANEVIIVEGKTHPADEEHGVKPKKKRKVPRR